MIDQYPPANGVLTSLIWRKTAVGGETSLSGYDNASQALSYTPGQEQVYLNGILLVRGSDYTATNGTSITSLTALAADDFVQINCYNNFSVASVPAASITGEVTNSQITSLATTKLTGTITNAQLAGSIANDKLTNSSITINGSAVSLGGSVSLAGDIESVTAGTGISGGGSSGAVTITNSMATAIDAKGDLIVGTGADTFSKLTAGANGTTLVADSAEATGLKWATPASGGGATLLSTTTLSGTSTTISSISGSYKNLLLLIEGVYTNNNNTLLQIYFNSDTTNLNYNTFGLRNSTADNRDGNAGAFARIAYMNNSSTTNNLGAGIVNLYNYTSTDIKYWNSAFSSFSNGARAGTFVTGTFSGSSAISSIKFDADASSFSAGTVKIYGVN